MKIGEIRVFKVVKRNANYLAIRIACHIRKQINKNTHANVSILDIQLLVYSSTNDNLVKNWHRHFGYVCYRSVKNCLECMHGCVGDGVRTRIEVKLNRKILLLTMYDNNNDNSCAVAK